MVGIVDLVFLRLLALMARRFLFDEMDCSGASVSSSGSLDAISKMVLPAFCLDSRSLTLLAGV